MTRVDAPLAPPGQARRRPARDLADTAVTVAVGMAGCLALIALGAAWSMCWDVSPPLVTLPTVALPVAAWVIRRMAHRRTGHHPLDVS